MSHHLRLASRPASLVASLFAPLCASLFALFVLGAVAAAPAGAQGAAAQPAAARQPRQPHHAAGLPPLIDRELLFGAPEIAGAQLSPDGRFVAFLRPIKGTLNIWVKTVAQKFDEARPLSADTTRPIPAFFWTRDGKYIVYVKDKGGDENFNIYAVDPAAPPAAGSTVPEARDLTKLTGVAVQIVALPRNDPDALYIGLNDRDKAWHDLYKLSISTGQRTLVRQNTERIAAWTFDRADALRLAVRVTDNGSTEILRVDPGGFTVVQTASVFETSQPVAFHPDGKRAYLMTNKGDADLIRLVLFDPATKGEELVEQDPKGRVDLGEPVLSDRTGALIATAYEDDRTRRYWKDAAFAADYRILERRFPGKEIDLGSITADEQLLLISVSSDVEPGERWLFDRRTKGLSFQYRARPRIVRTQLATMRAIRYPSSDGLEVAAYLTLPLGVTPKALPLVVFPHGGPWARDTWGYRSFPQFLANRGYAVLQPNFRASTGYGKKFLNAGNKRWGETMQDDITWGVKHLVAQGIADPKRVAIMGGSYGGYATLAGVAFTPDVYAAGVAIVAPSNLITLLETIPPYWEAVRTIFNTRMGDPRLPADRAMLERQSPLNSVAKIRAPLLVVQGANDPRVNKRESDQIVIALRDRGFPVEYIVAPDEGHGFARPVNNMAMNAAAERFLAKHIGGRFQEGGTAEVVKRLAEITVDPKTVVVAPRLVAGGTPAPARDLAAATYAYKGTIVMGAQSRALEAIVTIAAHPDGGWAVTERALLPTGTVLDSGRLEAKTLVPLSRTIQQGPVSLSIAFSGSNAQGQMSINGQVRPIVAEMGGRLFADGAAAYHVLGRLPLAAGYSTTIRNFDLQTAKASLKLVKVTGSESVTVPAGTFDAWVVEQSDEGGANKTTIWIAKASGTPVRITAAVQGGTITTELVK